ncbi:MAG: HD domain-containing protein [Clostridia bacterium]|nr:HD domain-containing protein [Clostridia bacterium]
MIVKMNNLFLEEAANEVNPKWEKMILRREPLYQKKYDVRSQFERDYNRVIFSTAYRRLKHKTQVFYSPTIDHISTRFEHVKYVESVSYTMAKYMGLNTELTKVIANAHDLGHGPFGHRGEKILSEILMRDIGKRFWHERNGLEMVENIELLEDNENNKQNLNLTYAVRDGIISHCGEIDEKTLKPRKEYIDLDDYTTPNKYSPYTWEGCVVKISDKISYIGRDIEDAIKLKIIEKEELKELYKMLDYNEEQDLNNTIIINTLVYDLCENSSPEKGLCFSKEGLNLLDTIKKFNYKKIYNSKLLNPSQRFFEVVIHEIYNILKSTYDGKNTLKNIEVLEKYYGTLMPNFKEWLNEYIDKEDRKGLKNRVLFDLNNPRDFYQAIVYYISGMTDNFAIDMYNEIIEY